MYKIASLATATVFAATTAFAGTVAYVAPAAPVMIEEPASMGGSGMWLIPLIAIALIALAMSADDEEVGEIILVQG